MHVCIISPTSITDKANWGGVHTHTEMLCKILIKQGIKVSLITPDYLNRVDEKIIDGVRCIFISGVAKRMVDKVWIRKVHEAFIRIHKEEPIDCIFSEGYWAYGLQKELMIRDLPIFSFVHNFHLIHFYNNSKDIKTIRSLASYLFKTIPKLVFRIFKYEISFYHNSKYVISVSKLNAWYLEKVYCIPKDKIRVINNWVDTTVFSPNDSIRDKFRKDLNILKDTLVFLLVGSLWRSKGSYVAIKSFSKFIKKFPNALLLIAGEGRQEKYLRKLTVKNENVGKRVMFLGRWDYNKLPTLYNATDVFLMPSIISEGCPYTPIEAMACGLPVIASKRGGNIETIGDAGILVSAGNANSLAEAMLGLAKNSEKRKILSEKARKRVLEFFAEDIAIKKIQTLLNDYNHRDEI